MRASEVEAQGCVTTSSAYSIHSSSAGVGTVASGGRRREAGDTLIEGRVDGNHVGSVAMSKEMHIDIVAGRHPLVSVCVSPV